MENTPFIETEGGHEAIRVANQCCACIVTDLDVKVGEVTKKIDAVMVLVEAIGKKMDELMSMLDQCEVQSE